MADLPALDVFYGGPEAFAPRAAWVLATLLAPLGRRAQLVTEREAAGGCALAYAPEPVPGVPSLACSSVAMEAFARRNPLPEGSFAPRTSPFGDAVGAFPSGADGGIGEGFVLPFDPVASAFALLTCWDEYTCGERDRFGRLPYAAGVFAANPALKIEEPAVDAYVALLRAVLAPRLRELGLAELPPTGWVWRKENASAVTRGEDGAGSGCSAVNPEVDGAAAAPGAGGFAVALTHDIDNVWRWTPRGFLASGYRGARALRHGNGGALRREAGDVAHWLTRHLPRRTDPFWTFPQMLEGEDDRGVSSSFYVIARHTHPQDGNQPKEYRRRIPAALELLRRAGREVGLHGNDADRLGPQPLRHDRKDLARRAGAPVSGLRFHYLRCLYHETLPYADEAGFTYDTSLGYAEHEGYRCGASFPFHPYHLEEERPLRLLELPLAIMDTTLMNANYRDLDAAGAEAACVALLDGLRASGGGAAVLWHNNRFDRRSAQGYDDVYWRLVEHATSAGALVGSAEQLVERWLERVGETP